jgi:hypothetical protein
MAEPQSSRWKLPGRSHNPEVAGSNPAPATRRARREKSQRALRYGGTEALTAPMSDRASPAGCRCRVPRGYQDCAMSILIRTGEQMSKLVGS